MIEVGFGIVDETDHRAGKSVKRPPRLLPHFLPVLYAARNDRNVYRLSP